MAKWPKRGHGDKLSRKGEDAIAALLAKGHNIKQAAEACGISHHTLRKWLRQPTFAREYESARHQQAQQVRGLLLAGEAALLPMAMKVLQEAMKDDNEVRVRIAAARVIMWHATQVASAQGGVSPEHILEPVLSQESVLAAFAESCGPPPKKDDFP